MTALFLLAVNPQARRDLWILADADSSDLMFRFQQIRDTAKTDTYYSSWFMFDNFDIFSHTSTSTGMQITQILNALISMLNSYRRLPAVIVIVMSERLMYDSALKISDTREVLRSLCRQLVRCIESWLDQVPSKAKPTEKTRIYITKLLPKPSAYFTKEIDKLKFFSSIRREYNTALVAAVKEFGIGFINVGINQEDGLFFKRAKRHDDFNLSDKGLVAFWTGVSTALHNLNGMTQIDKQHTQKQQENWHYHQPGNTSSYGRVFTNNQEHKNRKPGNNTRRRISIDNKFYN